MWECLIRTTGGALEPAKSDWVKIVHKWKYGTSYLEKADSSDVLKMRDPNGETTALQQKEPTTARLLLGVWQSPVGDETKMKDTLKAAVVKWGQNITKSSMSTAEALTATKQTIGRSIRYPLAATAMNRRECKEIQVPLCKYRMGKLGVV